MVLAEVYLNRSTREFDQAYTYIVPEHLLGEIEVGCLVSLPFGRGNSSRQAWVANLLTDDSQFDSEFISKLKSIDKILAPSLLRPDQFRLALEMRRRYFCSTSQALTLMAPQLLVTTGAKTQRYSYLVDEEEVIDLLEEGSLRSMGQVRVLEFLLEVGEASLQEIMISCDVSRSVLDGLRKKKLIANYNKEVERDTEDRQVVERPGEEHVLNQEQAKALASILENQKLAPHEFSEYLLYGVTGSGKTEVYLRAAEAVLNEGKDVIILVPEISLTPLICDRIQARFGKAAAVIHSRLSPGERYDQWKSIRTGEKRLVAGARSAIFAPLAKIGLIIVDEEQEATYKSERTPRYNALDVARLRSSMHGAKLLLASATPSVETFYRSQENKSKLLTLKERAGGARLPQSEVVDMRSELAFDPGTIISRRLKDTLAQSFERGEQAMIFLNRRGHASFMLCQDCGYIHQCSNCEISMTDHINPRSRSQHLLICHYCGVIEKAPNLCPECGSKHFGSYGIGTQQAEKILQDMFPQQKILRMDLDTTSSRFGHAKILSSFANKEADLLVGTQMIAKGHDFPDVTTVGILAADLLLGQGDYLAEERSFQLISQASGRAGRRDLPGKVIIQSFNPDHFVIQTAMRQDYEHFYNEEIHKRKVLEYPPFSNLGVIITSSMSERLAKHSANRLATELEHLIKSNKLQDQVFAYPAQAAPIPRLRKRWRYRLLVKSPSLSVLTQCFTYLNDLKQEDQVSISFDINPKSLS